MKRTTKGIFLGAFMTMLAATAKSYANPICERLRHELEHHCGAGLEFYATHQNRDLVIMNTPYPSSLESLSPKVICKYNDAPGLISIHAMGSHCEEAANIAGNLCFRQNFSHLVDVGIDDLTANRNCSEAISYSPLDPSLAKGYLWGAGFTRTKYVLVINNVEGFIERRVNPDYIGDEQPESRIVKMSFVDPNFEGLRELLQAIRIDTMSASQCESLKSMTSRPLQNLGVIMIDGMTASLEFNTREGAVITNSPCVEVRGFFPKFNDAVSYLSRF